MRLIWTLAFVIGMIGLAAAFPGACFDPQLPTVAFRCGEQNACPDGYECRSDGCCHKEGSPLDEHGACSDNLLDAGTPDTGAPDASVPDASVPDASAPDTGVPDAQVTPDASASDTGVPDAQVTQDASA